MILIHRTFTIVTPESAQEGECSDQGFKSENESVSLRELVEILREHPEASSSHHNGETSVWFTSYPSTDYHTGEEENTAVHYSRDNPKRKAKYWSLAVKLAGV